MTYIINYLHLFLYVFNMVIRNFKTKSFSQHITVGLSYSKTSFLPSVCIRFKHGDASNSISCVLLYSSILLLGDICVFFSFLSPLQTVLFE